MEILVLINQVTSIGVRSVMTSLSVADGWDCSAAGVVAAAARCIPTMQEVIPRSSAGYISPRGDLPLIH